MPCYQRVEIKQVRMNFEREILACALDSVKKELLEAFPGALLHDHGNGITMSVNGLNFTFYYATQTALIEETFPPAAVNILKRNYSMAVVKKCASTTRMKQIFKAKQLNSRQLLLQRR